MTHLTPAVATIIAAVISAAVALLVCMFNIKAQNKKLVTELQNQNLERAKVDAARDAEIKMWMKQVDHKLDVHNGYAMRFAEIQTDIAVIKNDIKTLYKNGG